MSGRGDGPLGFGDDEPGDAAAGAGGAAGDSGDSGDEAARDARRRDEEARDQERRWAHRRDPDLEILPPPTGAPRRPAGASRYGWFVGVVVVLLLVLVTVNTIRTDSQSSTGLMIGQKLPPFAVPLALSDLDGDANVAVKRGSGSAGSRPACEVRGPRVLNSCQLSERGPVVLSFIATRGGRCEDELDRLQAVARDFPTVQVAAISIRGSRSNLQELIRDKGWNFPVGYDRDGVLANLYGIAVCPQTTYADRGGRVRATAIGEETEAQLRRRFERLAAR